MSKTCISCPPKCHVSPSASATSIPGIRPLSAAGPTTCHPSKRISGQIETGPFIQQTEAGSTQLKDDAQPKFFKNPRALIRKPTDASTIGKLTKAGKCTGELVSMKDGRGVKSSTPRLRLTHFSDWGLGGEQDCLVPVPRTSASTPGCHRYGPCTTCTCTSRRRTVVPRTISSLPETM